MKISILLPYKENYTDNAAGAVSLFINDTAKLSKFKKNIRIFGSTTYKSLLSKNYTNIELNQNSLFVSCKCCRTIDLQSIVLWPEPSDTSLKSIA